MPEMDDSEQRLKLPWCSEFSPGTLGEHALAETLEIFAERSGDRSQIVEAIRSRWFTQSALSREDPAERLVQQRKRAGNVVIAMKNFDLVDNEASLTELGAALQSESDEQTRNRMFVKFVLKEKQGLELLSIVGGMQERGIKVSNDALRSELRAHGYSVTTNNGDAGKLRQWLETAGVVSSDWRIDHARLAEITGTSLAVVGEWQSLTRSQRAFLATIRRLSETRGKLPIASPELLDFVRDEHGPIFDEGQVKKIYAALVDGGWITHEVKAGGRGGKGGSIAATDKLIDVDFELLVGFRPGDLPADLRAVMTKPLQEIYSDLNSENTYTKGIALELLAVSLASDLGLTPLSLRVRGVRTGGAEVDLVAEGIHLHFSRWLFQCKNTKHVDVGVLAKEIGMATLLQAQVVVIATTGTFSEPVRTYAKRISETTAFQVVLVDGATLKAYKSGGATELRKVFRSSARTTMQLKRPQVLESLQEIAEDER